MSNREITDKRQPPKPGRGALPAEIKAWIEKCRAQSTPEELAELEQTGDDLKAIFNRIGFDPASQTFAPRDRSFEIEFNPDCKQS